MVATIRTAVEAGATVDAGLLRISPADLQGAVFRAKESNLIVFVVDASGSMAARDRLAAVTGAIHSLLTDAYRRRDKVAVISVRGTAPEVIVPPTGSVEVAHKLLAKVTTGGRTPLAEGILLTDELIAREVRREPGRPAIIVVLTDGRATGADARTRLASAAAMVAGRDQVSTVVIDCETSGRLRLGMARDLAENLKGECIRLEQLNADAVAGVIRAL